MVERIKRQLKERSESRAENEIPELSEMQKQDKKNGG
jgi:hypothetical protein